MEKVANNRLLIVDDNHDIHRRFIQILSKKKPPTSLLAKTKAFLSKKTHQSEYHIEYQIDSAYQGKEALEMVRQAVQSNQPYALLFLDIHLPPGWDGVVTLQHIWEVDPDIEVVICTAYASYNEEKSIAELLNKNNFLILKKPFEPIEIKQLTNALTSKWFTKKIAQQQISHLRKLTKQLETSFSIMKATLEATEEGILVVNKDTQAVVTYNKLFLRLWGLTDAELTKESFESILRKMSTKAKESNLFFNMILALSLQPEAGFTREWLLYNDTTMELYTHPQYQHNEIVGCVFSFRNITDHKELEKQLMHKAMHDSLTGLANRVLLIDRMQQAISYAKRYDFVVGVLLVDLDNFKQVNDSMGHHAGDTVLITAADRLKKFIRETDTVARLGGDEFVILLLSKPNDAILIAKINAIIELFLLPCKIENTDFIITASIGVSVYPRDGEDTDTLLKNADAALYRAKEAGRNTFQFYQPIFNAGLLEQVSLSSALHHALANHELSLRYQPLINLEKGNIEGIEALLRWNHPTLGMVSPEKFLPLAEKSGLIVPIGEWVIRQACLQNKAWQDAGLLPLRISVNISPMQFRNKDFVTSLAKILQQTKLEAKYLELEITERLFMEKPQQIADKMHEVKQLGVFFAIDDFGMGFSSLNYLKDFPLDKVKIDKSFIQNITVNKESEAIVEAIISLTKQIGLQVSAEGVEKIEQINFLKEHHSNQVQGYYFSTPLDVDAFTQLIKDFSKKL